MDFKTKLKDVIRTLSNGLDNSVKEDFDKSEEDGTIEIDLTPYITEDIDDKKCPKCGADLNEQGTCPVCDDGEEDYEGEHNRTLHGGADSTDNTDNDDDGDFEECMDVVKEDYENLSKEDEFTLRTLDDPEFQNRLNGTTTAEQIYNLVDSIFAERGIELTRGSRAENIINILGLLADYESNNKDLEQVATLNPYAGGKLKYQENNGNKDRAAYVAAYDVITDNAFGGKNKANKVGYTRYRYR